MIRNWLFLDKMILIQELYCSFSPLCFFSDVSSSCQPDRMQSYTGCIYFSFPRHVFLNVLLNSQPERFHNLTGCIYFLPFLHRVFSSVSSKCLPAKMRGCKVTLLAFVQLSPLCVFKCILKVSAWEEAKSHCLHLFGFSPLCIFKCDLKWPAHEDV